MIGQTIHHYKLIEKLGGGAMGVVYKAENVRLNSFVALKFLPPELTRDDESRQRFQREARSASRLDHQNICVVHDIDETPEGHLYISMAYYDGETLKHKMKPGGIPVDVAVDYASQVARGLEAAHKNGILHRDVKPANLIVTKDGVVKIVDFGLAKLRGVSTLTALDSTVGTVFYMSPEQAEGREVDARSDVWSLGVVLYQMLTGVLPFPGEHPQAVIYSILNQDPRPVHEIRPEVSSDLSDAVMRCLKKDPSQRFSSMKELLASLDPHSKKSEPPVPKPWPLKKGLAPALVILALLAFALINFPCGVTTPQKHLAVLPFVNVGKDPKSQDFCDGLVQTLTSQLTQLESFHGALWVVPSSEISARDVKSASEARRAFQVNLVITGSVQRAKGRVRLTLNLVDAETLRQVHSKVFTTSDDQLTNLQDEIIFSVASILNVELAEPSRRILTAGATTVSDAYELYLQARGNLVHYGEPARLDYAISLFEQAIAADSLYALAHAGLGEACWRKYEYLLDTAWSERAIRACRRAADLNSYLVPVHVTLGMIKTGTGRAEEALADFNRALTLDPNDDAALRGRANAYRALQRTAEAEADFRAAIELKPDYWGGYNDLGVFYYMEGRLVEAAAQFEKVVELTPHSVRGYNNLGGIYYYVDQEEAKRVYQRSLEIEPSYEALSNLGSLLYSEGNYSKAAELYWESIEINPNDHIVWGNLGNALTWSSSESDSTEKAYRRAVELAEKVRNVNPSDPYLLANLAGYYIALDLKDEALAVIAEAHEIAPEDAYVTYRAGHIYATLGDSPNARQWLEQALEQGYPVSDLESDPWLEDLRADPDFRDLLDAHRPDP